MKNYDYVISSLYDYLKKGEKPKKYHQIGIEFEHFVLNKNTGFSFPFNNIEKIFKNLLNYNYKPVYEKNKIIALYNETESLTIEPGAQLEISITPQKSISKIMKIYEKFQKKITPIVSKQNGKLISIGYHPIQKNFEIKLVPKTRYKFMLKYFKTKSALGKFMMKSTNTIHINLDYKSEDDFKNSFLLVQRLAPIANLLFSNSPFANNCISESNFRRIICWLNTDDDRCGFIQEAFDNNFGYLKYAERILNTPMIVVLKNGKFSYVGETTYFNYLKKLKFTKENMVNQFTMLFPIIRAKQHIEIRLSDGLKNNFKIFPILFWTGILYNEKIKSELLTYTNKWTYKDVSKLYFRIINDGFKIKTFKNKKFIKIIEYILYQSLRGLSSKEKKYKAKYNTYINYVLNKQKSLSEIELENFKQSNKNILNYLMEDYEEFCFV